VRVSTTRAVSYRRVSSNEQVDSGLGLSAQTAAIERAAIAAEWDLVADFVDEGISGAIAPKKRPALAQALELVETGAADVLVVASLDRVSRSVSDLCDLLDQSAKQGWDFVAINLGVDTRTVMGRGMVQMAGVFAEIERGLIGERTKSAMAISKADGKHIGRPVIMDETIRQRIAAERAEGRSYAAIADGLNADAVPTARGGACWYPAVVRKVALLVARGPLDGLRGPKKVAA